MRQTTRVLGGRYEVGPVLGSGGMATVHHGMDRTLERPVAVKILAEPYVRDRAFVERFRREAHAAARLNHPNIVSVYDSGSDDGMHFIVMELVEGRNLGDRLDLEGSLAPQEAARIGADVAQALDAAHSRGVIHRDVKPSNVLLTDDGRVKVVDFGIARASGAEEITRSGLVLGSASYVSPEQARGSSGDERSDLYGLGCVLYEMLTGRPPFVAADAVSSLYQHVNERPAPPSSIRSVPDDLERVVLRCLEKDPDLRFGSAHELERALLEATDEISATMPLPPVTAEPTQPLSRRPSEPTAPVGGASEPTAPVGGASEPTARIKSGRRATHRRPSPRPSRWGVVAAVGVLVAAGLAVLLTDPVRLPSRAELRDARREARAATGTTGVAGVERVANASPSAGASSSVAEAHRALRDAILAAEGAGGIVDEIASELLDDADRATEAYQLGDATALKDGLTELLDEFATAMDEEEISVDAAQTIDAALDELVLALSTAPIAERSPSETPGAGDASGGPPAHAEGHDEDHGNDE